MYQLQVEGMSCGHCAGRVTKAVQSLDNGAKVDVDLGSKTVRIDSSADLDRITSVIADEGYEVTAKAVV